jgi:nuclear pore complex protein Nup155
VPQYYTGSDGRGTVDDISPRLREGCPSYFKESDYKFYLAVERLERAALTSDAEEKENVAREAFSFLSKVPGSADLQTVCKRFEDLRFYEAVVCLPLQKAQALDPAGDAFNDQLDASIREHALAQRKQCYEIIANALRSLASPLASPTLDEASRSQYICQIVHLGVQSTDRAFREYLYKAMIELHLENELLEYGGPDLVPFLQNAGSHSESQVGAVSTGSSPLGHSGTQISSDQAKYFDLLAKYYVSKRQHVLAAHVFLRLAERRAISLGDSPTLERR